MRAFSKISFAVLAMAALACIAPQSAQAYWHSGVYFGVGAPGYWAPPPRPVYVEPAPVIVAEPAPVIVSRAPRQVSMQCASGPTVTVTGYKPTGLLLRQAAALCAQRDAAMPPPQGIAWNDDSQGDEPYCREYQSKTTVGGRVQQSYGTACQQPDGSWKIQN